MRFAVTRDGRIGWTRTELAAILLWSLTLAVITIRVAASGNHVHNVFLIYHKAAWNWLEGKDLYASYPDVDRFHYSPLAAAALVPFGILPVKMAGVLWRLLNAGVYLGGLGWCCRSLWPQLSRNQRGLLFLLIIPMSIPSINNGQSNALVLGLLLATLAATLEERWTLAGVLTALAVLLKLYPVAVGLLFTALFPRRFGPRFFAALLAGLLLPFCFQLPQYVAGQYASWFNSISTDDRSTLPLQLWLRDIRFLFKVWLTPLSSTSFIAMQLAVGGGIAVLCLAGRRRNWPLRKLLTVVFGLGCCWMTVFGPMVESCTWILVAPALALLLVECWQTGRSGWPRAVLTLSFVLFMLDHMFGWWPGGRELRSLGAQPAAGLFLFVTLVAQSLLSLFTASGPASITTGKQFPNERNRSTIEVPFEDSLSSRLIARTLGLSGLGSRVLSLYCESAWGVRLFLYARWRWTPYEQAASCLPRAGVILDLGSGHGLLSLAMGLSEPARTVRGIDHDTSRVAQAQQAAASLPNVSFTTGTLLDAFADVNTRGRIAGIVVFDALHYLTFDEQELFLKRCRNALQFGGVLLIRDVDANAGGTFFINRLHERIMTGLGFTHAERLSFRSQSEWLDLLARAGFEAASRPCSHFPFADRLFVCRVAKASMIRAA